MGFGLGDLLRAGVLFLNSVAVLNEERFLKKREIVSALLCIALCAVCADSQDASAFNASQMVCQLTAWMCKMASSFKL